MSFLSGDALAWSVASTSRQLRRHAHSPRLLRRWIDSFFVSGLAPGPGMPPQLMPFVERDLERVRTWHGSEVPFPMAASTVEDCAAFLGPALPRRVAIEVLVRAPRACLMQARPWTQLTEEDWTEVHLRRFVQAVPRNTLACASDNFTRRLYQVNQAWRASTAVPGKRFFDAVVLPCVGAAHTTSVSTSSWLDELNPAGVLDVFRGVRGLWKPQMAELIAQEHVGIFVAPYVLNPDLRVHVCGFYSRQPAHMSRVNTRLDAQRSRLAPIRMAGDPGVHIVGDALALCCLNCNESQMTPPMWGALKKELSEQGLLDSFDAKTSVYNLPQVYVSLSVDDLRAHPGLGSLCLA